MAKIRTALKQVLIACALITALMLFRLIPTLSTQFYFWLGATIFFGLVCWLIFKFKRKPDKYINERGYVVLVRENELEHRYIAKQMLERDLAQNEVVHHINGNKTDNELRNLCLMDSEKHEHFHAWLRWKKEKNKRYPPISHQKRVLVDEYVGILLENLISLKEPISNERIDVFKKDHAVRLEKFMVRRNKNTNKAFLEFDEEILISPEGKDIELDPERFSEQEEVLKSELTEKQLEVFQNKLNNKDASETNYKNKLESQKRLFAELRKERKRIADEKNVPAYIVFDDKTLIEMSEVMPDTELMMLQVRGVGPYKYKLYGSYFIAVVKKFKSDLHPDPSRRRNSA